MSQSRPGHRHHLILILAALLVAGCADDASRMDSAREFAEQGKYRAAAIELKNVLRSNADNAEARAMLGEISLKTGDSATAIKELRRARELGAAADVYAVPMARAQLREQRYQEVAKLNPDLIADTAIRATAHALIGTAQLALDEDEKARSSYAKALELSPGQPDALIGQARLEHAAGNIDAAIGLLKELVAQNPANAEARGVLGRLQLQNAEPAAAEQNFQAALEAIEGTGLAFERMNYMAGLIDAMLAQDKTAQAQATAATMIDVTKQAPLALFQAARADFQAGDYEATIEKAGRIVTAHPAAEPPKLLVAGAAIAQKNFALAATHLQAAVNVNPANQKARKLLAQVRMQMGDPDEALALLQPMIEAGTTDPQVLTMAGAASIRSGRTDAGVELAERTMQFESADPAVALQTAANFLLGGELDRAIEVLEALPEADTVGHRDLMLILAMMQKGEPEAARARAEAIVAARPDAADSHRLMGGFHMAVEELDEARASFERALEIDPNDVAALTNLARIDVAENRPEAAEALFVDFLQRQPGNLVALTALAQLAETRGDTDKALRLIEQAREANPSAISPRMTLGRYYANTGELEKAEAVALEAARIEPGNGEAHVLVGTVLIQDGRYAEALTRLERAVATAPNLAGAHYQLGRALLATGQDDASYRAFERAIELDADFFPPRVALASANMKRGDLGAAQEIAEALVNDYPRRGEPLLLLGDILLARNDQPAALEAFRESMRLQPSRTAASRLAVTRRQLGEDQPWTDLEQWVQENPGDAAAHAVLGQIFQESGLSERAIGHFEKSLELEPDAGVATVIGNLYRQSGEPDAAVPWLNRAMEIDPSNLQARMLLATVEFERGNLQRATGLADDLAEENPGNADILTLHGDILLQAGDYAGATEAFDAAASIRPGEIATIKRYEARRQASRDDAWRVLEDWFDDHPGHVRAGIMLAQDYTSREWHDEAVSAYRKVLSTDPTNVVALNNLAWVYLKRGDEGDLKRALNAAERAYRERPDNPSIADTYGWVLLQEDNVDQAMPLLRKAAQGESDPEIRYHFAVALESAGENAEAAAVLDRLLADGDAFDSRADAEALRRRLP